MSATTTAIAVGRRLGAWLSPRTDGNGSDLARDTPSKSDHKENDD